MLRVGVDTGGTFTDLVLIDIDHGTAALHKLPSTPDDPSLAIVHGLMELLAAHRADRGHVSFLGHGTTVATNAVIEGRLPKTALLTTSGFRDVIELARQRRPHLYDLDVDKPHPLATRDMRWELDERMQYDGTPLRPVREPEVQAVLAEVAALGAESVAIVLLHSYVNPAHEQLVKAMVQRQLPDVAVCASSDVLPEFREYERTATTLFNAALMPVMSRYVTTLARRVRESGLRAVPQIMQSSGGLMGPEAAAEKPINTLASGPSAGVIGAAYVSRLAGSENLITFDMGGTSTDVCLVERGQPAFAYERVIGGEHPVQVPLIDVHSVGAGGGSIGWIDRGGLLKVGPRSAAARPGPACYDRGGTEPTVTDANVVLGYLDREHLLDGRMTISAARAAEAIERTLGRPLDLSLTDAAKGVIRVVNVNMQRALRVISVERGRDPREFTLVAFGGAGPVHATQLALDMGIPRVLVPESPGVLCALGLLVADVRADFSRTVLMKGEEADLSSMTALFAELEGQARAWLAREEVGPDAISLLRSVDMRYLGQNYELRVQVDSAEIGRSELQALNRSFHREHARAYGYSAPEAPTQIVNFRVVAVGRVPKPTFHAEPAVAANPSAALVGERTVWFLDADRPLACPVYRRALLSPGTELAGPAIIEQMDTTTSLLPGQRARVDGYRNLIVEIRLRSGMFSDAGSSRKGRKEG